MDILYGYGQEESHLPEFVQIPECLFFIKGNWLEDSSNLFIENR